MLDLTCVVSLNPGTTETVVEPSVEAVTALATDELGRLELSQHKDCCIKYWIDSIHYPTYNIKPSQ